MYLPDPLHTALAIYGCLLGYTLIADEMKNPLLKMVEIIEATGRPSWWWIPAFWIPKQFIDEVVTKRPNPFMPDTPQRIATTDTSEAAHPFGEPLSIQRISRLSLEDLHIILLFLLDGCAI